MTPRNKVNCSKAHRRTRTPGKAPRTPTRIAENAARLTRELYRIGPNGNGKHTRRLLADVAKAWRTRDIITCYGPATLALSPGGGLAVHISGWIIHYPA